VIRKNETSDQLDEKMFRTVLILWYSFIGVQLSKRVVMVCAIDGANTNMAHGVEFANSIGHTSLAGVMGMP